MWLIIVTIRNHNHLCGVKTTLQPHFEDHAKFGKQKGKVSVKGVTLLPHWWQYSKLLSKATVARCAKVGYIAYGDAVHTMTGILKYDEFDLITVSWNIVKDFRAV